MINVIPFSKYCLILIILYLMALNEDMETYDYNKGINISFCNSSMNSDYEKLTLKYSEGKGSVKLPMMINQAWPYADGYFCTPICRYVACCYPIPCCPDQ